MTAEFTVQKRFCGPSDSANGGYCCGRFASFLAGAVEVTLKTPPPLERALSVEFAERAILSSAGTVLAEAQAKPLDLEVKSAPSFSEACEWSKSYRGFSEYHPYPECFVCGPARRENDGLRIFAGRDPNGSTVAAPWVPDPSLKGVGERVAPEFLWAAIDCPGYFAFSDVNKALLGRMHGEVLGDLAVGERCVVVGWSLGSEGRKLFAGTALWTDSGRLIAKARQIWITL